MPTRIVETLEQFVRNRIKEADGPLATKCWLWQRSIGVKNGYGRAGLNKRFGVSRGRQIIYAHRLAWKVYVGEIPAGMSVLHACDVRACCNPAHLFLGTQKDNIQDASRKGRTLRGEKQPTSKLRTEDVLAIRASPLRQCDLARAYKVSPVIICQIIKRDRWGHI